MVATKSNAGLTKLRAQGTPELIPAHCAGMHVSAIVEGGFSIFSLYLKVGVGTRWENAEYLAKLGKVLRGLTAEWLVAGDWNNSPDDIKGFAGSVGGVIVKATGPTCVTAGSESCIDST